VGYFSEEPDCREGAGGRVKINIDRGIKAVSTCGKE